MLALLVKKSGNEKTGPMPVSYTEPKSCPDACPLKASNACYAKHGKTRMAWQKVERGIGRACDWATFCRRVAALPEGVLWRHNVAGDLPGEGDKIDVRALLALVKANAGKRGFTYTHKPLTPHNFDSIRAATMGGFTVNVSCDTLAEVDFYRMVDASMPMAVVLPEFYGRESAPMTLKTAKGHVVRVCPAVRHEHMTCSKCGLCQKAERRVVVGFPAHGPGRRLAEAVANG